MTQSKTKRSARKRRGKRRWLFTDKVVATSGEKRAANMFETLKDTKRHRIHPDMKKGHEEAEEWKVLLDDEEDECSDSESEEVYKNELDATKAKATGQFDKLKKVLGNTKASKEEKPPVAAPKRKNGKADAANAQNDELDPQDDAALAKEARKQDKLAL